MEGGNGMTEATLDEILKAVGAASDKATAPVGALDQWENVLKGAERLLGLLDKSDSVQIGLRAICQKYGITLPSPAQVVEGLKAASPTHEQFMNQVNQLSAGQVQEAAAVLASHYQQAQQAQGKPDQVKNDG